MDFGNLKTSIEKIEMSDEMQARIIKNCRLSATYKTEEFTMKKRNTNWFMKPIAIAAVLTLCMVAAGAASHFGMFKDITNWSGAVTGTEYVQATDDIQLNVSAAEDNLAVTVTLLTPDTLPYSELETMGIGSYKIVDQNGNVVFNGENSDFSLIVDGKVNISISLNGIENGSYKLVVDTFSGAKKADNILRISGSWECEFTI